MRARGLPLLLAAAACLMAVSPAAAQAGCACAFDGISGGVPTGRLGCAAHLQAASGDAEPFCMVVNPASCPTATPSGPFPGAAWVPCQPGAQASASAQASAQADAPQWGRKWVPGGSATASAGAAADATAGGGGWGGGQSTAQADAASSAQASGGGSGKHHGKPSGSSQASAQAAAAAQAASGGKGGSAAASAQAAADAAARGGIGSAQASAVASASASAETTATGCALAQAVASASASASGVLPPQVHPLASGGSTGPALQLSASALAQAQALAASPGCLANPAAFGCTLAQSVATAQAQTDVTARVFGTNVPTRVTVTADAQAQAQAVLGSGACGPAGGQGQAYAAADAAAYAARPDPAAQPACQRCSAAGQQPPATGRQARVSAHIAPAPAFQGRLSNFALSQCLTVSSLLHPAGGQLQRFDTPKTASGLPVDFCRSFGTDCGQLAAAAWCVSKGFTGAAEYGGPVDTPTGTTTAFPLDPSASCTTTVPPPCQTFSYILCYKV
ncbi:hypothetical protein ABPG75_005652 [Micractinium tetrahymenae]